MVSAFPKYCTLDQSTNEIRLMRIHGRVDGDDVVTCSLETVQLRDANPFYALSYVWGPDEVGGRVMIEGEEIHIRRNLWLFLRTLRDRFCGTMKAGEACSAGRTIRVWADYICIQQSDPDEREYQVSIMGEIYQAADAVYAWLGESQLPHDDGMRCIQEIKSQRAQNRPWSEIPREHIESRLSNVTSSVYWSRLWIKQEILLGKDVWFFFGLDASNWRDLYFATTLRQKNLAGPRIRRTPAWSSKTTTAVSGFSFIRPKQAMVSLLNMRALQPGKVALPELIGKFHNAGCQDGRDRIYALLSMTDTETRQQIAIDYRKPLLQVLLETYHHWTGEPVSWLTTDGSGHPNPHYNFFGFCAQLVRVLTFEELGSLRHSEALRQAVTVRGVFTAFVHSEISSVCVIACTDSTRVRPLSGVQELDASSRAFVLQVSVKPASGRSENRSEHFIYAASMPRDGDLIARLGQRVFFLRRCHVSDQRWRESEEVRLDLFATGTEMSATSLTEGDDERLSTKYLQHPCLWVRQQLRDAIFEIAMPGFSAVDASRPPGGYDGGVQVVCNSAAILTLLSESRLYKERLSDHSVRCPDEATEEVLRDTKAEEGISGALEDDISELWSPYVFGVQHQVLMACRKCKTMGRGLFSKRMEGEECECTWVPSTTPV